MALMDFLKQKKADAAPAKLAPSTALSGAESGADLAAAPEKEQPPQKTLQEWLAECRPKFAEIDVNAPVSSATTAEFARSAFFENMPLDDGASISVMELLVMWTKIDKKAEGLGLGRCPACGQHNVYAGGLNATGKNPCTSCKQPVTVRQIVYSRELGAALRDKILPAHARCIEAIKSIGLGTEQLEQAVSVAEAVGHKVALKEIERRKLVNELTRIMFVAALSAIAVPGKSDGAPIVGKDSKSISSEEAISSAAAIIEAISQHAHKCVDAKHPGLAITALESAMKTRDILLLKFPKHIDLRRAQAFDLDELGMVMRDHEPARRLESLGFVRRAGEMLAELDREDPAGREGRKSARAEIAEHLKLKW